MKPSGKLARLRVSVFGQTGPSSALVGEPTRLRSKSNPKRGIFIVDLLYNLTSVFLGKRLRTISGTLLLMESIGRREISPL